MNKSDDSMLLFARLAGPACAGKGARTARRDGGGDVGSGELEPLGVAIRQAGTVLPHVRRL